MDNSLKEDNVALRLPKSQHSLRGWTGDIAWLREDSNCYFCDNVGVDCVVILGKHESSKAIICLDCIDKVLSMAPEVDIPKGNIAS
jgi:hypothetical protein